MAHAGKLVSNTVMAGTVKFIKTAADTGGELLEMEATYNTAVDSVLEHYHPYQDEHIEVLAGMVSVHFKGQGAHLCNRRKLRLSAQRTTQLPWRRW